VEYSFSGFIPTKKKNHIRVQTGAVSELIRAVATACLFFENIVCQMKQFGFPTVDTKIPEILNFGAKNKKKNRIKARKLRVANRGVAG